MSPKFNYMIMTPSAREASDEITMQINGHQIEYSMNVSQRQNFLE